MTQTARDVIVAVMNEVSGVAKRDKNTQQGFNFRGIDAVVNAIGPALRKAGGFIVPTVVSNTHESVIAKNGGTLNVVRLEVQFEVFGKEGDPVTGIVASEAFDSGDKATAKAMSVAFRTFMLQLFALPTDETDPDADSYEVAAPAKTAKPATDWDAAIAAATNRVELLDLFSEAKKAKAPKAVLDAITAKGQSVGQ